MGRPKDPKARAALVAAARREFVRVGIQRARIEDITHACGLSKGAFYLHFESKEALFRELVLALQERFEAVRLSRDAAHRGLPRKAPRGAAQGPYAAKLMEIDAREDRALLELLWDWRDVTDVLLRGSQGTEFASVIWTILDREAERVERECAVLEGAGLMRDDVPSFVIGSMIIGTYLLIARRLSTLTQKPAFEPLVAALQSVMTEGISPPAYRRARDAAAIRAAPLPRRRTAPKPARARRS